MVTGGSGVNGLRVSKLSGILSWCSKFLVPPNLKTKDSFSNNDSSGNKKRHY